MWRSDGYVYNGFSVFASKARLELQEKLCENNPNIEQAGALWAMVCVLGEGLTSLPVDVFPRQDRAGVDLFFECLPSDMVMSWARVGRTLAFAVRTAEPTGAEGEELFLTRLTEVGNLFVSAAADALNLDVSLSISMVFEEFENCEQLACEALVAADFIRFMEQTVSVLTYHYCNSVKLILEKKNPDYRLNNYERPIISAVLNENLTHAEQIVNDLLTSYLLDPLYVFPSMAAGIVSIVRVCQALVCTNPRELADSNPRIPKLVNQISTCPTLTEMRKIIHVYFEVLDKYNRSNKEMEARSIRMTNILKFIYDNVSNPMLGAPMVCDKFGMSTTYFSRIFKEDLGVNFSVFLQTVRITQAKAYLLETDMNMNEIAENVGISTQNLLRLFKRFEGMSPSAYRQAVLENRIKL